MNTRITTAAVLLVAALATPAMAQLRFHRDGGGYTYRSNHGNSTYSYRYGTGAAYNRTGNFATYNDNTGTTGSSLYGTGGRYDSFSNSREGWSGSGYTPYGTTGVSSYERSPSGAGAGLLGLGAVGVGGGVYGFRRLTRLAK